MALQKELKTQQGLIPYVAYIKIVNMYGNKDLMNISVESFRKETVKEEVKTIVKENVIAESGAEVVVEKEVFETKEVEKYLKVEELGSFQFKPNLVVTENFYIQGYNFLKTLPQFEGAESC